MAESLLHRHAKDAKNHLAELRARLERTRGLAAAHLSAHAAMVTEAGGTPPEPAQEVQPE